MSSRISIRGLLATVALAGVVTATLGAPALAGKNGSGVLLKDDFEGYRKNSTWRDSSTHGHWRSQFNGYGRVKVAAATSKVLSLAPRPSKQPSETHAALVTSQDDFGDVDLTMRMKTVRQLRSGTPNPWEVAWAIWHYRDNTHFYYVTLKPNGWEIGKADPRYPGAQRFLATGSTHYSLRKWHTVRVRQVGQTMEVWANGKLLTEFTDEERPYTSGSVGVYNEDALTLFDDIVVSSPNAS